MGDFLRRNWFQLGATVVGLGTLLATIQLMQTTLAATSDAIGTHAAMPVHPVAGSKIEQLERRADRTDEKLDRIVSNLSAVCQATNAECR